MRDGFRLAVVHLVDVLVVADKQAAFADVTLGRRTTERLCNGCFVLGDLLLNDV